MTGGESEGGKSGNWWISMFIGVAQVLVLLGGTYSVWYFSKWLGGC